LGRLALIGFAFLRGGDGQSRPSMAAFFPSELIRDGTVLQKTRVYWVLGLLIVAGLLPVSALAAAGLYTGSAPVNSQSEEDRAGALRAALGQVIIKLSSDPAVLSRPDVAKAIARADRYMQQYSYQPNTTAAPDSPRFMLIAQFDSARVDGLLHDLNLDSGAAAAAPAGADAPAAAAATSAGSFRLWFSGLRSAEDYARLIGGLSANEQVRSVRVEQAHGTSVQIRIDARGGLQSLLESLDLTRLAHTTNAHPPVEGIDALLDFEP
jgi:Uncharacterized protein conserved in bacteria (DUF2066)